MTGWQVSSRPLGEVGVKKAEKTIFRIVIYDFIAPAQEFCDL